MFTKYGLRELKDKGQKMREMEIGGVFGLRMSGLLGQPRASQVRYSWSCVELHAGTIRNYKMV